MRTLLTLCATLPLLVTGLNCPSDGYEDLALGDNRCYKYSTAENLTWTLAYTACLTSANGTGNLLTLPDANSYYPQYYQIRDGGQDVWTGLLFIGGQHSWADGTPYNQSIDQFIAADAGDDTFGYMSGDDGLFRHADGGTERGYACYVDLTPGPEPTPSPTPTPDPCDSGWKQYSETCYLFSTEQEYWPSAGHACHVLDAELISIHDPGLLTFLLLTADDAVTYWTGLENQNQTYVWEDETTTDDVTDIVGPYMDDWSVGNDCLALSAGEFPTPLKHRNCLTEQHYICYKDAVIEEGFFVPEHLRRWL